MKVVVMSRSRDRLDRVILIVLKNRGIFLLVFALLAFIYCLISIARPLGYDQGIFIYVASKIAEGQKYYLDVYEHKGPLSSIFFVPFSSDPNTAQYLVRLFDNLLLIISSFFLYKICLKLVSFSASIFAAILWVFAYLNFGFWNTAQPDGWVAMLQIISVYFLISPKKTGAANLLGFAVATALASLVKPVYLMYFVLPFFCAKRFFSNSPKHRVSLIFGIYVLAMTVSIVPFLSVIDISAAYEAVLEFNLSGHVYTKVVSVSELVPKIFEVLYRNNATFYFPVLIIGIKHAIEMRQCLQYKLLFVWSCLALLTMGIQGKYFDYHFIPSLPILVVFVAVSYDKCLAKIENVRMLNKSEIGRSLVPIFLIFLAAMPPFIREASDFVSSFKFGKREDNYGYLEKFEYADLRFNARYAMELSRYVRERTTAVHTIYGHFLGSHINFFARRDAPTRFSFNHPIITPSKFQNSYTNELIQGILDSPTKYIILDEPFAGVSPPDIKRLIEMYYSIEIEIYNYTVYRRTGFIPDVVTYPLFNLPPLEKS